MLLHSLPRPAMDLNMPYHTIILFYTNTKLCFYPGINQQMPTYQRPLTSYYAFVFLRILHDKVGTASLVESWI